MVSVPAAFGRLCVETQNGVMLSLAHPSQPPSGGCVVKPYEKLLDNWGIKPAAFGRLCVETDIDAANSFFPNPAAFGRLCVETISLVIASGLAKPAAFGRLCVETLFCRHFRVI